MLHVNHFVSKNNDALTSRHTIKPLRGPSNYREWYITVVRMDITVLTLLISKEFVLLHSAVWMKRGRIV